MGVLNVTPDSFSDGGRFFSKGQAVAHASRMLEEGAAILDVGGYSSRPGAEEVTVEEELARVVPVVEEIMRMHPDAIVSVDTFRTQVAEAALATGASLLNDITAGADPGMFDLAARHHAPLVLMHMQGSPQTMQVSPQYADVVMEVRAHLVQRVRLAREAGVTDLVLDPGFGFGKTLEHNYALFRALPQFATLGLPLLVGISRKSMIWKLVGASPLEVGDLSAALHLQALLAGAGILRVHDVPATMRILTLHHALAHGAV